MKNTTLSLIKEKEKEFDERFPINQSQDGKPFWSERNNIKSHISSTIISILESLREELPPKKEMLDKNDPDNYEAIYAITGFNDAITKVSDHLTTLIINLKE